MKARQYVIVVILAGLVPAIALLALNLLVDPYNELGIRLVPRPLVETSRAEKTSLLRRLETQPELMIFGSSRAMELDPDRFPIPSFNIAVNSALPEDLLAQLLWLEHHGLLPRKALLMIDFYVFNPSVHTDARLESARFLYRWIDHFPQAKALRLGRSRNEIITPFWLKYFSRRMARDSWRAIKINLKQEARSLGFRPNGLLVRKRDLEQRRHTGWNFNVQEKLRSYTAEKYTDYTHLSQERIRLLEFALDVLRRNQIEFALGLTPFHPALAEYIDGDPELAKRLREVATQLGELSTRHSAPFLDYRDIRSFGCDEGEMWDLIHLMPECADRMVNDIVTTSGLFRAPDSGTKNESLHSEIPRRQ